MLRRVLVVLPAILLLGLLGVGLFRTRPVAELGAPAPDVPMQTLRGPGLSEMRVGELRGRPVVLNFWASWCEPCKSEAPELAAVAERMSDRVQFLGVSILDGRDEALAFLDRYGVGYPSAFDPSGRLSKLYRVTGVPETVFIDARGRIVGKFIGAFREGQLDPIVRDLVALPDGDLLRITGRGETRPVP